MTVRGNEEMVGDDMHEASGPLAPLFRIWTLIG